MKKIVSHLLIVGIFLGGILYAFIPDHQAIVEYKGPSTCIECHPTQAQGMFNSVHYQWTGPTPNVPNIPANAGKGDLGFNTYCGSVISSPRATCASCHIGYGGTPDSTLSYHQLANIDCMMCHQEQYQRKLVNPYPIGDFNWDRYVDTDDLMIITNQWLSMNCPLPLGCGPADLTNNQNIDLQDFSIFSQHWAECTDGDAPCSYTGGFAQLTFTDYLGISRTWTLPVHDDQGNFQYGPDEAAMGMTAAQAAQGVHLPTRAACLRCHAYAAGTDCGKRGDISTGSINPPANLDIHMSPDAEGQDMRCQDCHTFANHHVLGRGLDLRPNDRPERLTCTHCHGPQPHELDDEGRLLNQHAGRVACQSCHIPTYAKLGQSTEVERNWMHPHWAAGLFGGQGGYKPEELRDSNLVPTYEWFDGTSLVYAAGQIITQNAGGYYAMGVPNGDVNSDDAQIYPMKEHISNSARHDATGQLIPHSTFKFFVTGDFNQAVADGMNQAGLTGSWTLVAVHTYQTINHGVEPSDNALGCGQCHDSLGPGTPRMNLQGQLGYALKNGLSNGNCTICHGVKEVKPFKTIHDIHVKDKRYDCSYCHNFSRPERNLQMPM